MSKIGRSGRSGRSTICCQQFGLECQRLEEVKEVEEVRFVASNLGLSAKVWKKWKKYDLLPAMWACVSKIERSGRSTICCQQLTPECQRLIDVEGVEEVRFVASNLGLSVKDWKKWRKYDLLPAIWA